MIKSTPFVLSLVILCANNAVAQESKVYVGIKPIPGYRNILEKRVNSGSKWFQNINANLDELTRVVTQKNCPSAFLLPLHRLDDNRDTVVMFCINKRLMTRRNKPPVRFFSAEISDRISRASVMTIKLKDLKSQEFKMSYDSIFEMMKTNMFINAELFDLQKSFDSDSTSYCCEPRAGYRNNDKFVLIYFFFLNGIILGEDHFERLYYMPY